MLDVFMDYRTSNLTDAFGTISFVSFAPGDYVVRPMVKEYKFDPSSKLITLTQGQTAEVSWKGTRVAYSTLGKVSSLGGDPEVGLVIEAVSKPPCPQMQEECVTGNDGQFRISGLKVGKNLLPHYGNLFIGHVNFTGWLRLRSASKVW